MATRIEIITKLADTRSAIRKEHLEAILGKALASCHIVDVYTIDKNLTEKQFETLASALCNPVTQKYVIAMSETTKQSPTRLPRPLKARLAFDGSDRNDDLKPFDWAIEIGFLPGVTDNIATTTKEIAQD